MDLDQCQQVQVDLKLEEGEIICDKCSGYGSYPLPHKLKNNELSGLCPKCWGNKKVDWIENAMGVQKPDLSFFDSSASISSSSITSDSLDSSICINGVPLDDHIMNIMGQQIAEQVDKQIMAVLTKISSGEEQHL